MNNGMLELGSYVGEQKNITNSFQSDVERSELFEASPYSEYNTGSPGISETRSSSWPVDDNKDHRQHSVDLSYQSINRKLDDSQCRCTSTLESVYSLRKSNFSLFSQNSNQASRSSNHNQAKTRRLRQTTRPGRKKAVVQSRKPAKSQPGQQRPTKSKKPVNDKRSKKPTPYSNGSTRPTLPVVEHSKSHNTKQPNAPKPTSIGQSKPRAMTQPTTRPFKSPSMNPPTVPRAKSVGRKLPARKHFNKTNLTPDGISQLPDTEQSKKPTAHLTRPGKANRSNFNKSRLSNNNQTVIKSVSAQPSQSSAEIQIRLSPWSRYKAYSAVVKAFQSHSNRIKSSQSKAETVLESSFMH